MAALIFLTFDALTLPSAVEKPPVPLELLAAEVALELVDELLTVLLAAALEAVLLLVVLLAADEAAVLEVALLAWLLAAGELPSPPPPPPPQAPSRARRSEVIRA